MYSTDDFARANDEVYWFLASQSENSKYADLDLKYIVTPGYSGYTTYTYSSSSEGFPRDLRLKVDEIFKRSLNNRQTEGGADEPATAPELESSGNDNPNPESKPRSQ